MRTRLLLLAAAVAIVVAVGVALMRHGVGPSAYPQGCSATVEGHTVGLSTVQGRNATLIAAIGVRRGLPARAVSIALATALQESKIRNLHRGDLDSVGLFQQRPSQGWGSRRQILHERYAINRFYDALQRVPHYQSLPITVAAQTVQHSAYPDAYAVHELDAKALASALTGYSPGGQFSCVWHATSGYGTADAVIASLRAGYGVTPARRTGARQNLEVSVGQGLFGNAVGWSQAAYLVAHAGPLHIRALSFDGHHWAVGRASVDGWTTAPSASRRRILVSLG